MVFSTVPTYLDQPNCNQQQPHLPITPGLAAPRPDAGLAVSVRPGTMADRARVANLPQPEQRLKCPRCDSTNTKFCYFNNYSLSQPRHLCKECRRYWTQGGTLRNVPVGGGCRSKKRSKSSASSKKPSATTSTIDRQTDTSATAPTASGRGCPILSTILPASQSSFMNSLRPLTDYGGSNLGLGYAGIYPIESPDYQVRIRTSSRLEQLRIHQNPQFPLFTEGTEPTLPVPFDGEGGGEGLASQFLPKVSGSGLISLMASVKMDDINPQGLNFLPRSDRRYWGGSGGSWAGDLSHFNSSSSGNIL